MDLGLAGKVVLLTGGSGGLGGSLAHGFTGEGAHVALTYLTNESVAKDTSPQIERTGGQALTVRYDLADVGSIPDAVQAVVSAAADVANAVVFLGSAAN